MQIRQITPSREFNYRMFGLPHGMTLSKSTAVSWAKQKYSAKRSLIFKEFRDRVDDPNLRICFAIFNHLMFGFS